jgi:hypothetical protein
MALFSVKLKSSFSHKGARYEKGMEVELLSKQSSAPNLLSAGKQEIVDAFQRKFGVTLESIHLSNNYLEVVKH